MAKKFKASALALAGTVRDTLQTAESDRRWNGYMGYGDEAVKLALVAVIGVLLYLGSPLWAADLGRAMSGRPPRAEIALLLSLLRPEYAVALSFTLLALAVKQRMN